MIDHDFKLKLEAKEKKTSTENGWFVLEQACINRKGLAQVISNRLNFCQVVNNFGQAIHNFLSLVLYHSQIENDKVDHSRCFIFVESCFSDIRFFFQELAFGVLVEA